eukprot:15342205-Alexandrium_andersonii.AAC.1
MSASLVGSEMCIRDSLHTVCGSEHSDLRLSFAEKVPRLHAARDLKVRPEGEQTTRRWPEAY